MQLLEHTTETIHDLSGFPLQLVGSFSSAVEVSSLGHSSNANSVFCQHENQTYTLEYNATSYLAFTLGEGLETMTIALSVQHGSTDIDGATVILNPISQETVSTKVLNTLAYIKGRPVLESRHISGQLLFANSANHIDEGDTPKNHHTWSTKLHSSRPNCLICITIIAGFLVPLADISLSGAESQTIGMSVSTWETCFQCIKPNTCTEVAGNNSSDQFLPFRQNTLAERISNTDAICEFLHRPNSFTGPSGVNSLQSVSCFYPNATLNINMTLDGDAFGLHQILQASQMNIDEYTVNWTLSRNILSLIVLGSNVGAIDGLFKMVNMQCCLIPASYNKCQGIDATETSWILVQPGQQVVFKSNITILNYTQAMHGGCEYGMVSYEGSQQINISVPFYAQSADGLFPAIPSDDTPPTDPSSQALNIAATLSAVITVWGKIVAARIPAFLVR